MTATLALICALLAGCTVAAPRSAPVQPAQSGAPLDPARVPAAAIADVRAVGTPGAPYQTAPYAVEKMLGSGIMAGGAPLTLAGGTSYSGNLAWADPKYGPRYLALREPRGTLVEACGPAGCVTRRSTDFGPVLSLWRAGRIADLSAADWQTVCGVPLRFGLCPGSIEILSRRPATALPNTDMEDRP